MVAARAEDGRALLVGLGTSFCGGGDIALRLLGIAIAFTFL